MFWKSVKGFEPSGCLYPVLYFQASHPFYPLLCGSVTWNLIRNRLRVTFAVSCCVFILYVTISCHSPGIPQVKKRTRRICAFPVSVVFIRFSAAGHGRLSAHHPWEYSHPSGRYGTSRKPPGQSSRCRSGRRGWSSPHRFPCTSVPHRWQRR